MNGPAQSCRRENTGRNPVKFYPSASRRLHGPPPACRARSLVGLVAGGLGLLAGLVAPVGAAPPGPLDGRNIPADHSASTELAVQTNRTGFGDQDIRYGDYITGSELDGLFLARDDERLFVGLTGNLQQNGHAFVIFIGFVNPAPGDMGQVELRAEGVDGPPYTVQDASRQIVISTNGPGDPSDDTWSYGAGGTILPCPAHLALAVDTCAGTMSISLYDLADPSWGPVGAYDPTPANTTDPLMDVYAVRTFIGRGPINDSNDQIEEPFTPSFLIAGFDNTNTTGVTWQDASSADAAHTGFEAGIPLTYLDGQDMLYVYVAMLDGGGGAWNGVVTNQMLPPTTATAEPCNPPGVVGWRPNLPTLAVCRLVTVSALPPFTGTAEGVIQPSDYGLTVPLNAQSCPTPYGDQQYDPQILVLNHPGSELDVLWAANDAEYLYLGLTGNLEPGGNSINLFLDTDPDNWPLDAGVHWLNFGGANPGGSIGGMDFDELPNGILPADQAANYNYAYRLNIGGGGNPLYVDFLDLVNSVSEYRGYVGLGGGAAGDPLLGGDYSFNPNRMCVGGDNFNTTGVVGCGNGDPCHLASNAEVETWARTASLGFEVAIPLADIGLAFDPLPHRIRAWAYVTGGGGYGSDQGLPSLRNVSGGGSQVGVAGDGPNNYTDPWNAVLWRNYEARSADYLLQAALPAPDCNWNGLPDWLDIATGSSPDCNTNGVPDECDLSERGSPDCNWNSVPDECDVADGFSMDCQPNGIPDECDLSEGESPDCNWNSIPDECDLMWGFDFDADGDVDLYDYAWFPDCVGGPGHPPSPGDPNCLASCQRSFDYNYDWSVDLADFFVFQVILGVSP